MRLACIITRQLHQLRSSLLKWKIEILYWLTEFQIQAMIWGEIDVLNFFENLLIFYNSFLSQIKIFAVIFIVVIFFFRWLFIRWFWISWVITYFVILIYYISIFYFLFVDQILVIQILIILFYFKIRFFFSLCPIKLEFKIFKLIVF